MRLPVVFVLLGCVVVIGCGSGSDPPAPPAQAGDTSVQRAGTGPAPAADAADAAPAPPPGADHGDRHRAAAAAGSPGGVLRGSYTRLNGERDDLARYRGDVVLIVNTATECGFTPQFEGLEALYRERRADGLVVLGFPANDFAGQEPRSNGEIAEFCKANYGVTFPMFAKSVVTGDRANPLFRRLSSAAGAPEWNFNKYLVDRRGKVVARFGAGTEPDAVELRERIERLL